MDKRLLTHKEIERMCDGFMESLGWDRAHQTLLNNEGEVRVYADRIYIKENEIPLLFEVKPENAKSEEIKKGIGQLACCLPFQVKPYLVLSRKHWNIYGYPITFMPWLGVIVYEGTAFSIKQQPFREDSGNLSPITGLEKVKSKKGGSKYTYYTPQVTSFL